MVFPCAFFSGRVGTLAVACRRITIRTAGRALRYHDTLPRCFCCAFPLVHESSVTVFRSPVANVLAVFASLSRPRPIVLSLDSLLVPAIQLRKSFLQLWPILNVQNLLIIEFLGGNPAFARALAQLLILYILYWPEFAVLYLTNIHGNVSLVNLTLDGPAALNSIAGFKGNRLVPVMKGPVLMIKNLLLGNKMLMSLVKVSVFLVKSRCLYFWSKCLYF